MKLKNSRTLSGRRRKCSPNVIGGGYPVCQQLHLYEGMSIQENQCKANPAADKRRHFHPGSKCPCPRTAVLHSSMCCCSNALFTDNIWFANNDLTEESTNTSKQAAVFRYNHQNSFFCAAALSILFVCQSTFKL